MSDLHAEARASQQHPIQIYHFLGDLTVGALRPVFGGQAVHTRYMDEGRVEVAIQTGSDRDADSPHWIHPLDIAQHPALEGLGPADYTNASRVDWTEPDADRIWTSQPDPAQGRAVLVYDSGALIPLPNGIVDSYGKHAFEPSAVHKGLIAVLMRVSAAEATPRERLRFGLGQFVASKLRKRRHGLVLHGGKPVDTRAVEAV